MNEQAGYAIILAKFYAIYISLVSRGMFFAFA